MHIIEIILEGFKSYPVKTSISQFDQQFNAITGLNGSGKSNIIDAICFVLGISSLQHVRVSNLQELIYKQGNAGVNKASVTIIFDNTNKKASPPTLISEDKIVITRSIFEGKSKYILNGKQETADKIKSIFMQVQLNVNNPHFLVMQGRIAQVINMKPEQILSLIEEASGTSLYENRKLASLKIIGKKQSKLDEISNIVLQEISPQLERLKKEKEVYMAFKRNESELNSLWKQIVAYEYYSTEKSKSVKSNEVDRLRSEGEDLVRNIDSQKAECDRLEEDINNAKKNDITHIKSQWDVMQKDMIRLEKDLVDKQANLKNVEKNLKDNENVQKKLTRYMDDLKRNINKNKKRREEVMMLVRKYKREYDLKKEQLKQIVQSLRDLNEGKDIAIDEGVGLKDQLNETKKNLDITLTEIKQVTNTINRLEREIKDLQESLNNLQNSNESIKQQIIKVQNELKTCNEQLQQKQYNQKAEQEKNMDKKKLEDQLKQVNQKLEDLSLGFQHQIELKYDPPCADFDKTLVRGRVVKLFQIREDKYATALEVIAGNKLYNIIVENDVAASLLIKNNCFRNRVNLIPNNKITSRETKKEVLEYVKNVARGKARFAIDLIKYHINLENSMRYIFGGAIVCDDAETAKKLAFDPYVKMKTVTLEGDVYNPTGELCGGYYNTSSDNQILRKVKELQRLEEEKRFLTNKHSEICNDLANLKKRAQDYLDKKAEIELHEHQLKLLKERLDVDQRDQLSIKLKNTEEDLEEAKKKQSTLCEFERKYRDDLDRLKIEIEELESKKDKKKELLEDMHTKLKNEIERVTKDLKINQREVDKLEYEGEENEKDMKNSKEQISKEVNEKEKLDEEQEELKKLIDDYTKLKADKREKMKQLQAEQIKATTSIKEKIDQKQKLDKLRESNLMEVRKLDQRIQKLNIEVTDLKQKLANIERENGWVLTEKHMFGNPESVEYKFDHDFDMKTKTQRFYKLKDETSNMKKHVNMRVDSMADQAERDYTELIKKRDRVMVDKERIEGTIKELDELKNHTLMQTYLQVNVNFKNIFSTLLPGATAELGLEDQTNIQKGVKMRVAFNNQWKESLSELSGGQRSLLALSLILSLLKYKPAPLYILDEIDAALDLSHTQNIGKMIKQHFPESQFLIISLKEGMFSNANVLFKVEFSEGKSKITRYQQQSKKK